MEAWAIVFIVFGISIVLYLLIKVLISLYNIFYIYFIAGRINLLDKAGGRWAVITGATDGIGKAYAEELADRGFNIYLISRTLSKLEEFKATLENNYKNIEVRVFALNFSTADVDAYSRLMAALDAVDVGILVNNVGTCYDYPEVTHKVAGGFNMLRDCIVINAMPPTMLSTSILPQMIQRGKGIIVNISSSISYHEMAYWNGYSSAKAYVSYFTRILRKEYKKSGIEVQLICPMLVTSKMSQVYETSVFVPSATKFAKSAVNTIFHTSETTGYWTHQLQAEMMSGLPNFLKDFASDKISLEKKDDILKNKNKE